MEVQLEGLALLATQQMVEKPKQPPREPIQNIYEQAIQYWGRKRQSLKLIEECGELITAVAKIHNQVGSERDVVGEVIDVELMCKQMRYLIQNPELWREIYNKKILRLHRILKGERIPPK